MARYTIQLGGGTVVGTVRFLVFFSLKCHLFLLNLSFELIKT